MLAPHLDDADALVAVLPAVAQGAAQTERDGRLAAIGPLLQAGLFRLLLPRSVGGAQADPLRFLRTVEQLAMVDASTAWCVSQTSVCAMCAALLRLEVAQPMFAAPDALLAWGFGAPGRAVPVPGGWRIDGAWSFASGSRHASWLGGSCAIIGADGAAQRDQAGRPVTRMMLFPQASAAFTDTWDVIGLRGTGSDSYAVDGLFVPEGYSFQFGALVQPHARAGLYAMPPDAMWGAGIASVALGVARAMLDALLSLATEKTPRGLRQSLADAPATQALVAQSDAGLRAARLLLHQAVGAAFGQAEADGAVGLAQRMDVRLASSHAIREARGVAEAVYHAAGTTAVFASQPFERRLRDMHAIGQHVHGRQQHFEVVGQFMLGLTPELAFL